MDKNNLVAWLPFDTSPTADKCGNTWTANGSPTIENGALKLTTSGQYVALDEGITLGGQNFTICCQARMDSGTTFYGRLFEFKVGDSDSQRFEVTRYNGSGNLQFCINRGSDSSSRTSNLSLTGKTFDLELDYMHSTSTWRLFVDGQLALTHTAALPSTTFKYPWIGRGKQDGGQWQGTISHFMVFDGVTLHSENFTPPTADDYFRLAMELDGYAPISLDFDVQRKVSLSQRPVAQYVSFTGNAGSYGLVPLDVLAGATTFTVEVKFATASTKNSGNNYTWGTIVGREIGGYDQNDFGLCVNNGRLCFWAEPKSGGSNSTHNTTSSATVNDGKIHKAAVVANADGSIDLYCDGELVAHTDNVNAKITDAQTILIAYNSDSDSLLQMDFYEARFWSIARTQGQIFADIQGDEAGLEAWYIPNGSTTLVDGSINGRDATLYGTPAYTYADIMPIDLSFDVVLRIFTPWRYVNAGTADDLIVTGTTLTDLPESKSITGTAFYQTQRAKCFDIPATDEIWINFNVYFDGTNRWRAFNGGDNSNPYNVGVTAQTHGSLSLVQNSEVLQGTSDICKKNQLQTVLLHMVSGSLAGVVEAWVDGTKIYRYVGDVNHGEDFADIYLQSDGAGTFFSNIVVSNAEIELGEGWQIFTFDTERQVTRTVDIDIDVERQVKNIVPFQVDFDVEIKDILPFTIAADTERKVIVPVDFFVDVELLSIVLVDFTADLARNIKANINLYKTDNSQYFSGGSSAPIVIPTQEVVPPATDNEAVTQSIEITIAEQQLTDQIKVVTAIPLDIMYPVQGQYLDYCCDMRVERVSKQGVLYTADCCTDLDELLYTPLNYDMPNILRTRIEVTISGMDKPKSVTITRPCVASKHVEKFANALGLEPVIQFEDFYTSVDVKGQKESGSTYADLIRDIFGWSARVLTQVINCYIRNGKLFVIQRGHEANIIDISGADMTLPVYTHELIRLFYQRNKYTTTTTHTSTLTVRTPVKKSSEVSDGETETDYEYDNENLLKKSRTVTYDKDGNEIETVTNYSYTTLDNGRKVLTKERTVKYVNGREEEATTTNHTPLNQGLAHSVRLDEDGDIIGEGVGQNSNDDRVTPYSQYQADDDDDETEETSSATVTKTIDGLSLIDTSFPIKTDIDIDDSDWPSDKPLPPEVGAARNAVDKSKGVGRLQQITDDIKFLNRKTKETVTLSIYNYPHVIDFNDRVVLFGHEYYLVSNRAQTTPRIYDEQALTLVRWF